MILLHDIENTLDTDTVVALGTFDGVHLGHRAVIGEAVRLAKELALTSAVFTFSNLPRNVFLPADRRIAPLCSFEEKARLIEGLGAELLIAPAFTPELASMSPEHFVGEMLAKRLRARRIVCGYDHRFGAGGRGDALLLQKLCEENGLGLTVVPPVTHNGEKISSTLIRRLIEDGMIEEANYLLGSR